MQVLALESLQDEYLSNAGAIENNRLHSLRSIELNNNHNSDKERSLQGINRRYDILHCSLCQRIDSTLTREHYWIAGRIICYNCFLVVW